MSNSLQSPDCSMPGSSVLHISWSFFKFMSIESVMPSNHLVLCRLLLLLPSVFLSIRVFSNESALPIWWPRYWSFSLSMSLSSENSGLISFRLTGLMSLLPKGLSRVFSSTTIQKHQVGLSDFRTHFSERKINWSWEM